MHCSGRPGLCAAAVIVAGAFGCGAPDDTVAGAARADGLLATDAGNGGALADATGAPDFQGVTDADAKALAGDVAEASPGDATLLPCMASAAMCDDGNACTADVCDPKQGCVHVPAAGPCDAGADACTVGACAAGSCKSQPKDCSDKNPCTVDACKAGKCSHKPGPDNAICLAGEVTDLVMIPAGEAVHGCDPAPKPDGTYDYYDAAEQGYFTCFQCSVPFVASAKLVMLSAFRIQRHEVTSAQHMACVDAGACDPLDLSKVVSSGVSDLLGPASCAGTDPSQANYGMNCLSPKAAHKFCAFLGGRFPTSAEYDKAMRGGCEKYAGQDCKKATPRFPWGEGKAKHGVHGICSLNSPELNPAQCAKTLFCPVGAAPLDVSVYGVHDLYGNLDEWIAEGPDEPCTVTNWPYQDPPLLKSPTYAHRSSGQCGSITGYPWRIPSVAAAAAFGFSESGESAAVQVGFRCVLPPT